MAILNLAGYARKERKMIPTSVQNLLATPYMLEHFVSKIYKINTNDIKSISVRPDNEGGLKGNLSDSGRLRVKIVMVNGTEELYYWFVKIMPQSSVNNGFNIFENEIAFYQKIVPEMRNFVLKEGLGEDFADFDVPEILYAHSNDDGAIIILRDIIADGYQHTRDENGDKFLSVEHAIAAVRSIAKLHAVSESLQNKQNFDLAAVHPTLAESGMLWTQAEMAERLEVMKDNYCELLEMSEELDSPTLLARFRKSFDSAERLVDLCQRRCEPGAVKSRTLQHGDFHFNNLMFKMDDNGAVKVKIVDWQLAYTGKTTGDLSYLLMSSLSRDNWSSYENVIKSEYFDAYDSTIKRLTDGKVEVTGLDMDYNDSLPLSFFLSCGNIMSADLQDKCVQFSYNLCKEAAMKEII